MGSAPGVQLLQPDNRKATSLYIPGVRAFAWSPSDNGRAAGAPPQTDTYTFPRTAPCFAHRASDTTAQQTHSGRRG